MVNYSALHANANFYKCVFFFLFGASWSWPTKPFSSRYMGPTAVINIYFHIQTQAKDSWLISCWGKASSYAHVTYPTSCAICNYHIYTSVQTGCTYQNHRPFVEDYVFSPVNFTQKLVFRETRGFVPVPTIQLQTLWGKSWEIAMKMTIFSQLSDAEWCSCAYRLCSGLVLHLFSALSPFFQITFQVREHKIRRYATRGLLITADHCFFSSCMLVTIWSKCSGLILEYEREEFLQTMFILMRLLWKPVSASE